MQCRDIMKRDIQCLRTTDTVRTAAQLMAAYGVGFLPVCDSDGAPLGTLTDRDITVRCVAYDYSLTTQVGDVMTVDVVACSPNDSLERAEEIMSDRQKSRIMCVDGTGQLVGVISLSDLAGHSSRKRIAKVLEQVTTREARRAAAAA
jgi:CBS domain-containing protein